MPIRRTTTGTKFKASGDLKRLLATKKLDTRLVGPIERYLMTKGPDEDRPTDVLHPSALCKNDKCPLADYYALKGMKPKHVAHSFRLETIFSEGHEYHRKWQGWLTELGLLEGMWQCPSCGHKWWDTSPVHCARCNHVGQKVPGRYTNMVYREVPLKSEQHRIAGHSDGKVGRSLIEIKSVGNGTIRVEAPSMYSKYQRSLVPADDPNATPKKWFDLDSLWRDLKRPFPGHLRQGMLYLAVAQIMGLDVDEMVFIYESKANGATKEFIVRLDEEVAAEMLDYALDIVWAVDNDRPPDCTVGINGCAECNAYTEDTSADQTEAPASEPDGEGVGGVDGAEPADEAQAGLAGAARGSHPARGLRAGRAAGEAGRVGGLRRSAARSG